MLNRTHLPTRHFSSAMNLALPPSCTTAEGARVIDLESENRNLIPVKRSVKLLLLSTDDPFSVLVRSHLQYLGYCVFTCNSSERAEGVLVARNDIDLWLIDVQSLGIEAMYFATKVRDLHPEIPIVLVVGAQQEETDIQRLFSQRWIRIRKPLEVPDLLATIHRALSGTPIVSKAGKRNEEWEYHEGEGLFHLLRSRPRKHVLN